MWNLAVVVVTFGALFAHCALASELYSELLDLQPLPRNKLLSSFQFNSISQPIEISYINESTLEKQTSKHSHYSLFSSSLGPVLESTNTRDLSLRFTQGWWDSQSWGKLPFNGSYSGGTGVEVVAIIEASNHISAKRNWQKLTKILSGFFCASLNSIDDSTTTYPNFITNFSSIDGNTSYRPITGNKLFLFRAALPSEPVCTENLTPFLKLLPTRGKSGISSLLDGHKVFDSLWHGMSIDVHTKCGETNELCRLELHQTINQVVDVIRSIRKRQEGGIPKPTLGDKLRCDSTKTNNIWQCFPLGEAAEQEWSLETLYGRKIKGPAFQDDKDVTRVSIKVEPTVWNVTMHRESADSRISNTLNGDGKGWILETIDLPFLYDFKFQTSNSSIVRPIEQPLLQVARSLTGYSLDKGGLRVAFTNTSKQPVRFIYFESLPWFMRLYMSTMKLSLNKMETKNTAEFIKDFYYRPSADRSRPSHLEMLIEVPALLTLAMTYDFDKSLLLYREYPPDANHGFDVEPAIIIVIKEDEQERESENYRSNERAKKVYEFRTTSLLLTLPTPDFSMPYNVIILTCTVMSLAFGIVFNLITKKTVTEEEFEMAAKDTGLGKLKSFIQLKVLRKSKID